MRILYVTWDAPEAVYLESLFLPIFEGLRAEGYVTDVLQFTWADRTRVERTAAACRAAGIGYAAAPVRRGLGGLGQLLSAVRGSGKIAEEATRIAADVVLARSTMPALATLIGARRARFPIAFDADGLPLDERVEFAGLNPRGPTYRLLRRIEAEMVRQSEVVLVRTPAARNILIERSGASKTKFAIVSNGRDPSIFKAGNADDRLRVRANFGIAEEPLIIYSGSLGGGKYMLPEMLEFYMEFHALEPRATLLILTASSVIAKEALALPRFASIRESTIVRTVQPSEVPSHLAAADAGLLGVPDTLSTSTVAPIKTAEYLLCGVPVVGTGSVGDNAAPIAAGVFKEVDFRSSSSRREAVRWIADQVMPGREQFRQRARTAGLARFTLAASVEQYRQALHVLEGLHHHLLPLRGKG